MPFEAFLHYLRPSVMRPFFQRRAKQLHPRAQRVETLYITYLRCISEESFVVRYEVGLSIGGNRRVAVPLWGNRLKPDAAEIHRYVSRRHPRLVTQPLSYTTADQFIIYREMPGRAMADYDNRNAQVFRSVLPQAARAAASIHRLRATVGRQRTYDDEIAYYRALTTKVQLHAPHLLPVVTKLVATISQALPALYQHGQASLVHGDFQLSNLIYDKQHRHLGIIDFSEASRFFGVTDVAAFLVHAQKHFLTSQSRSFFRATERTFLSHYCRYATAPLRRDITRWLPLSMIRSCLDVIATISVFAHDHSTPYYRALLTRLLAEATRWQKIALRPGAKQSPRQ